MECTPASKWRELKNSRKKSVWKGQKTSILEGSYVMREFGESLKNAQSQNKNEVNIHLRSQLGALELPPYTFVKKTTLNF